MVREAIMNPEDESLVDSAMNCLFYECGVNNISVMLQPHIKFMYEEDGLTTVSDFGLVNKKNVQMGMILLVEDKNCDTKKSNYSMMPQMAIELIANRLQNKSKVIKGASVNNFKVQLFEYEPEEQALENLSFCLFFGLPVSSKFTNTINLIGGPIDILEPNGREIFIQYLGIVFNSN